MVALARRLDHLLEIKGSLHNFSSNYYPLRCDVTQEEDILAAFQWVETNLGGVHVLVNNAGIAKFNANFYSMSIHDVSVKLFVHFYHLASRTLKKRILQ